MGPRHKKGMTWPHSIPPDLRRMLDSALSARSHGPAELWGEVRDWLILHGIEAPEKLPQDVKIERWIDQ